MAEIEVDTGRMKRQESNLQTIMNRLEKSMSQLEHINRKITQYLDSRAYQNIQRKIFQVSGRIGQNRQAVQSLKTALVGCCTLYKNAEEKVIGYFGRSSRVDWSQTGGITDWTKAVDIGGWEVSASQKSWSTGWSDFWNDFFHDGKAQDALYQWGVGISGSILGANVASKITAKILDFSLEHNTESEWDIKDRKAQLYHQLKAELTVGKIEAKNQIGILETDTEIDVLTGAATGKVYGALFDDNGVFAPGVGIAGEIGGSILAGKHEVQMGSDDVNAHVAASGDLVTGELKGKVQIGRVKTENGSYTTGVDIGGEAGAYLAKGEVKGGFELFGIEIDASLEGKLGFGANASAKATSDNAEVGIGASLLGGAGVKLKVDWSGLKKKIARWKLWGGSGGAW